MIDTRKVDAPNIPIKLLIPSELVRKIDEFGRGRATTRSAAILRLLDEALERRDAGAAV